MISLGDILLLRLKREYNEAFTERKVFVMISDREKTIHAKGFSVTENNKEPFSMSSTA